jgi:hypothetical protein
MRDNNYRGSVQVIVDIPEDVARLFAADVQGLSCAALEALALEGLRSGKLSTSQARRLLRIPSRYEMDGFLKVHGVLLPLTVEEIVHESDASASFTK